MATEKIKRPLIAHFLDTSDKMGEYSDAKFAIRGRLIFSVAIFTPQLHS